MIDNIEDLTSKLNELQLFCAKSLGQYDLLQEQKEELEIQLEKIEAEMEVFDKARLFLQHVSESARVIARDRIQTIVTKALQYVFGTSYSFKITLHKDSVGRPGADFLVITKQGSTIIESMPSLGKGGGVIDILAVSLKFAMLEIEDNDGPIWLDEPFKHVSKDYIPAAGRLMQFIYETSSRQVNIITHNTVLAASCKNQIVVSQAKGMSVINNGIR